MSFLSSYFNAIRNSQFFVSNKVLYCAIPKNNTKYWMSIFQHRANSDGDVSVLPDTDYSFTVVRDPHDRLISAMKTFCKRTRSHLDWTEEQNLEWMMDEWEDIAKDKDILKDEQFITHFMPQHLFIEAYDFDDIIPFTNQVQLLAKLGKYGIETRMGLVQQPLPTSCDARIKSIVQEYYSQDLELWESIA
jgi:hypothetical protein